MKLAWSAALLLLLPLPARASCLAERPWLLEAKVTACRKGDEDLRRALEPFRADHDTWVHIPQRLGSQGHLAQPYDDLIEQRVRNIGGVIVRLEPIRYRELSETPAPGRKPSATAWTKFDEVKPREYFLRLDHPDCESVPRRISFFVTADYCCDVIPPTDDTCLLDLPAVTLLPKELEDLETGD